MSKVKVPSPLGETSTCPEMAGLQVARLKIAPSTLSHHIKTLMVVGLINQVRDATTLVCHANFDVMRALVDFLVAECCADAESKDAERAG